jgi:hypothetical protein
MDTLESRLTINTILKTCYARIFSIAAIKLFASDDWQEKNSPSHITFERAPQQNDWPAKLLLRQAQGTNNFKAGIENYVRCVDF